MIKKKMHTKRIKNPKKKKGYKQKEGKNKKKKMKNMSINPYLDHRNRGGWKERSTENGGWGNEVVVE